MPESVPFINREQELARIDELIKEWGTLRFLCINAPGGLGKTRLLQEVRKRYMTSEQSRLLVTDIIDFDDHRLHLPENVARTIGQMLDQKTFEPYFLTLLDHRKMELAGVSHEHLVQIFLEADRTFITCFNEVANQRRIILLLDTTDALQGKDFWNYLEKMGHYLSNTIVMVAGRNATEIGNSLQAKFEGGLIEIIDLPPLQEEAGEWYLRQKEKLLYIDFEPELAQKILVLSGGNPIVIDLAVEWRARGISLDWLIQGRLEEIKELTNDEIRFRQQELERQLVRHIAQTRSQVDRLMLLMSHIYPLDIGMIMALLDMPENMAMSVFEEAKTYVFMKLLPDGRLTLHDVMRRLINEYVWPEIDPEGYRQRYDSGLAAKYLKNKIQKMAKQIAELEKEEKIAAQKGNTEIELMTFTTKESLEREIWTLRSEYLKHSLFVDINQGIRTFIDMFDEATRKFQFSFREILHLQIQQYANRLSSEQLYEVNSRRVKHLLDSGEYSKARDLAIKILEDTSITKDQQIYIHTSLATAYRGLGKLQEAVNYLEQALKICRDTPPIKQELEGSILNSIGWMYRLMGKWDEALVYYRHSIELIKETGDEAKLAMAYNNLGDIIGLQSNYDSALIYCQNALSLQESLGLEYDLGRTHNTLGIIYRGKENYSASLKHTNRAISIFERFENKEWLAMAYCERGITKWYIEELEDAWSDLEKSHQLYKETGGQFELANILHRKGHIAWDRGNNAEAEQYFKESVKIGRQVSDIQQTVNSLEGLVELYYFRGEQQHQQGNIEEREEWYTKAEEMALQWKIEFEDQGYDFPLYSGSRFRILGNIAYDRGDYSTALQYYLEAFPRIASLGGYFRYRLPEALNRLRKRIDQLPPKIASEWCKQFLIRWREEGLWDNFPEMNIMCEIVNDNAKRRESKQQI